MSTDDWNGIRIEWWPVDVDVTRWRWTARVLGQEIRGITEGRSVRKAKRQAARAYKLLIEQPARN